MTMSWIALSPLPSSSSQCYYGVGDIIPSLTARPNESSITWSRAAKKELGDI